MVWVRLMIQRIHVIVFTALLLSVSACASQPVMQPAIQADSRTGERSVLAGEWEYEDGASVLLSLDKQGDGTYEYKDGRFKTLRLEGHTWIGTWHQTENDREGGFWVKLSNDYSEGQGRWWYTRIGSDHTPSQKGGTFRLSKNTKASLTKLP